jgi:hypothetical protein
LYFTLKSESTGFPGFKSSTNSFTNPTTSN